MDTRSVLINGHIEPKQYAQDAIRGLNIPLQWTSSRLHQQSLVRHICGLSRWNKVERVCRGQEGCNGEQAGNSRLVNIRCRQGWEE